jgi:alpha-glucosidase
MKNNLSHILSIACLAVLLGACNSRNLSKYSLSSPNENAVVLFDLKDGTYSISRMGRILVRDANAAMVIGGDTVDMKGAVRSEIGFCSQTESTVLYRQAKVDVSYNYAVYDLRNDWKIEWRAFDDGIAYRFIYTGLDNVIVDDEVVRIAFDGNPEVTWAHSAGSPDPFKTSFENSYIVEPLADAGTVPAFLPASIKCADGIRVTLVESDLRAYPGMFVVPSEGTALKAVFAHYPAKFAKHPWRDMSYVDSTFNYISVYDGERTYPWRILKITESDAELPVDNLVYALAQPLCKEAFSGGTDWIKPGFSAWEWWNDWGLEGVDFKPGINQRTYEYYIDFAARNGLEYVVLDEGWYPVNEGLLMQPVPELNLPALVQYGRQRGVKLILWAIFNSVDEQLETVMRHYAGMGIAGFKIDFLDRNDQTAVEMAWRIADAAARHRLILDYHGIFPPAGLSRTYPNVVNYEGILGLENCKWNDTDVMDHPLYDVTVPYLRGMCGYADYTPGAMKNAYRKDFKVNYSQPMSMGTKAHQLALYITLDSPLSMLADSPTNYEKEPVATTFIVSLPRRYDEKVIMSGTMGQYIVVARRSGADWYVGGLTNWESRDIEMDWSFLDSERNYTIMAFTDADEARKFHLSETTPSQCRSIHLASGGGFLLKVIAKRK